jgi:hypothetical protein
MAGEVNCKVCQAFETETIDRLLTIGYGPAFVAARWEGLKRHHIKRHRDECLTEDQQARILAFLVAKAGDGGRG